MRKVILVGLFLFVKLIGNSQIQVDLDSMQVGDELMFLKKKTKLLSVYEDLLQFKKGWCIVDYVFTSHDGTILFFTIILSDGSRITINYDDLFMYNTKDDFKICR
jgi:hypothetical protein